MKLLIDDNTGKTFGLNANEACVYAAILKCTKAGRGWFANYRDLANALPFIIERTTVYRAVQKLLNLGLIEKRDNALFAVQNATESVQIATESVQIATESVQIATNPAPPITPLNKDSMNENKHATCVHTHDTRTTETQMYFDIRKIFNDKHGLHKICEGLAAEESWKKASQAKKLKLLEAVKSAKWDKPRLDWLIDDFPEPTPTNWQGTPQGGEMLNDGTAKIALCNGRYGIYTREDIDLFKLELADYQRANPTQN